jgi:hypothetical protein
MLAEGFGNEVEKDAEEADGQCGDGKGGVEEFEG